MKKKICIVVDNPVRDLKNVLLLSLDLLHNYDVYLIEQYNKREIFILNPSVVLFHNLRKNNTYLIKLCKKNNIAVCILDTEGGYDSFGIMSDIILKEIKYNVKLINLYFCWGNYFYKKLKKTIKKNLVTKLKLTGTPKADLIYFESKKKYKESIDILFNTSFPIINPRYGNKKKTIDSFQSELNYISFNKRKNYLKGAESNQKEFIELISKIARDFKEKKIFIRVHPFESREKYLSISYSFPNVKIITDNEDLNITLKRSKVLVHYNCTTAFEYSLLKKKKALMPNYFKSYKYLKYNTFIKKTSVLAKSYKILKKKIVEMLISKNINKIKINNNKFREIFWNFNGGAHKEIAMHLNKLNLKEKTNHQNFKDNFFRNNTTKEFIMNFFYLFDSMYYRYLRDLIYPWKKRDKELNFKLIQNEIKYLKNFKKIKNKITVKRANFDDQNSSRSAKIFSYKISV